MYVTPEQLADANRARLDAYFAIAHAQFADFERLSALNLNATKSAFENSVNQVKALLSAKSTREFVKLTAVAAPPTLEKAIAYSRNLYSWSTQAHAEMTKLARIQAAELNKTAISLLDQLSKKAPAGSHVAIAAIRSGMAAANATYVSLTKAVNETSDVAGSAVSVAATKAVKRHGKKQAAKPDKRKR